MFRKMRRIEKQKSNEECEKALQDAEYGVLAVIGDEGYPYAVPINFAYENGKLFFHSTSRSSHKIEAIKQNEKVSFCTVSQADIVPEKFDTMYDSVIAFGRARVLENPDEIKNAMNALILKYSSEYMEQGMAYIQAEKGLFLAVEIKIEHMTRKIGR